MSPVRDLQLVSTLMLCGLIWVVQLVHYPSFRYVAREEFARFHALHSRRITFLVALLMPVELLTAGLAAGRDPAAVPLLGLAPVVLIWVSTALLQVPAHRKLAAGYAAAAHHRLVRTNWIRTAAWTARGVLVVASTVGVCAAVQGDGEGPAGKLGHPLGTFLTVEGVAATPPGKVDPKRTLVVDTVNGAALERPVMVVLEESGRVLPPEGRVVLGGYETGRMIGTPPAEFEAARRAGREPRVSQAEFQFYRTFVVLSWVEPAR